MTISPEGLSLPHQTAVHPPIPRLLACCKPRVQVPDSILTAIPDAYGNISSMQGCHCPAPTRVRLRRRQYSSTTPYHRVLLLLVDSSPLLRFRLSGCTVPSVRCFPPSHLLKRWKCEWRQVALIELRNHVVGVHALRSSKSSGSHLP